MGHIDHGKTELARALSEKISTAGLDKHPQARSRGITIDLGFTMFMLDKFLVTLVDAPGHADLIRSVVAGAGIIDAALVVVAADKGPEIQTGEHIIVLDAVGVETVIPVITKIDLVDSNRIEDVQKTVQSVMRSAGYSDFPIIRVSAKTGEGIDELKGTLKQLLRPSKRMIDAEFMMPIDHAFPKRGHGTVVTGTVQQGRVQLGNRVELFPQRETAKVRSIQVFGLPREEAVAGDRIGLNVPEISDKIVKRGNYLGEPDSLNISSNLIATIDRNPLYQGRITKRMLVNATVGMPSVVAQIIPFQMEDSQPVALDETRERTFQAALLLSEPVVVHPEMKLLLLRTDLPPTAMRIVGSGRIEETPDSIRLLNKRTREGRVSRVREKDTLVEGIASTKRLAERIIGQSVETEHGVKGTVKTAFGTRGIVSVVFQEDVFESDKVVHTRFSEEEYSFGD
jgi:selenocysteine-specific elongation factor